MKTWYIIYAGEVRSWFHWYKEYWVVSEYGARIGPFRDVAKAQATLKALNDGEDVVRYDLS